jgi:hypothetical protein
MAEAEHRHAGAFRPEGQQFGAQQPQRLAAQAGRIKFGGVSRFDPHAVYIAQETARRDIRDRNRHRHSDAER